MKSLWFKSIATSAIIAVAGCAPSAHEAPAPAQTVLAPAFVTPATTSGDVGSAIVVPGTDHAHGRIVAATGFGGLEIYDLDGKRLKSIPGGDLAGVAIGYDVPLGDARTTVLAAADAEDNSLRLYTMDNAMPVLAAHTSPLDFAVEGVCLMSSHRNGALYAFVIGEDGSIAQQIVYADADGKLQTRRVRLIHLPSKLKGCVASRDGHLYVAEETVGIWRLQGNPEADLSPTVIDTTGSGHLGEETKGLALYDGGKGHHWLFASDSSEGRINVYDLAHDGRFVGSVSVSGTKGDTPIEEPGALFASSMNLGKAFPHGMLLVGDEDGGANYKQVSMADVARTLGLEPGTAQDPRKHEPPAIATVTALVETKPVASPGDAADDPAIWANPDDPAASLVVATDKKAGMYVYDMQGHPVDFRPDGNMNNTDLRTGFMLGGNKSVLVTASDRTHKTAAIYRLDTAARKLVPVADGKQDTGMRDPYGLCMYQDTAHDKTYLFINTGEGLMRQWRLDAGDNGRVRIHRVRDFHFDSQVEGCVADDASHTLYVDEEDVGIWKLGAAPDAGDAKTSIDRISDNPALKSDLEGVGIYHLGNGRGYIVASVQGNDNYAVYRLEGDHAYLGSFAVVADPARGIDGISQTDGLEVTSRNLGPGFEHGAMIAQDGRNVMPQENQNYKYVPWDAIARALHLDVREQP
ncbi:MAG TPA: phytase [Rhodanobacteraceae bacterium]|nr:phytase [Rhodanobacteraceae bacterium]